MNLSRLLLCLVLVGLCVPGVAGAAAVDPAPGEWTSEAAARGHGARAAVSFDVDDSVGVVQPVVDYNLRHCAGLARKFASDEATLGVVSVNEGRFVVRDRSRHGKVRVELRMRGVFDTETSAHGTVRGKVSYVRTGGSRKRAVCALPKLSWSTSLTTPAGLDDEGDDLGDDVGDDEDLGDDCDPDIDDCDLVEDDTDPDDGL
jgi:hypothetical protein